jgi:hypothetical protein
MNPTSAVYTHTVCGMLAGGRMAVDSSLVARSTRLFDTRTHELRRH